MRKLLMLVVLVAVVALGGLVGSAVAQEKAACDYPAVTAVDQWIPGANGVVLQGTPVCVLRVLQTDKGLERCAEVDGKPNLIVAVRTKAAMPGYNVDAVAEIETYFCQSQLRGK